MRKVFLVCILALIGVLPGAAQDDDRKIKDPIVIMTDRQSAKQTLIRVVRAEDELRYDETIGGLLKSANPFERERAALAAGRIGDERAVPQLNELLEKDPAAAVRAMAAFALGEIGSPAAAGPIIKTLKNTTLPPQIRARAVEAAGKIVSADPKDARAGELGAAILDTLEDESGRAEKQNRQVVLLGLTAALRAKPDEADYVLAKFLTNLDARIRADAANALARLRAKNAVEKFRAMLLTDGEPIARANAARALGAAEDKEAVSMLAEAAASDPDLRVRVNAIRALGSLKSERAADKLLDRGEKLLTGYKKSRFAHPVEKNELLEITGALGEILEKTRNERALVLLDELIRLDNMRSVDPAVARLKISQSDFEDFRGEKPEMDATDAWQAGALARLFGEIADLEDTEQGREHKKEAAALLRFALRGLIDSGGDESRKTDILVLPVLLNSYAAHKPEDLAEMLIAFLNHPDVFVRTAAANLLSREEPNEKNIRALREAFARALETDRDYNDAQLAILSALVKLNRARALGPLTDALDHYDYLLRRHAAELIRENDLDKGFPKIPNAAKKVGGVRPFDKKNRSKLGQILNGPKEYDRAVSRKNGEVRAVLTTEKGRFTIELLPEDAPLTVDNFIKLARSGYFNDVAIHRVVPNFVVQDGDPLGNGSGGPGWQIRDEINTVPYGRGTVGMALSGPHTGGSQWFVTHSPQPHLDGGYTVFGRVNETDMKIVDMLTRGDKILKIEIFEEGSRKVAKSAEKN